MGLRQFCDKLFGNSPWNWYDEFFFRMYEKEEYKESLKNVLIHAPISREYYETKTDLIEKNVELLSDEKSKFVYRRLIEFRMSGDKKKHPGCEKFQYFPRDIVHLSPEEVFIDCGGYTGDTTLEFLKESRGIYKKIVIFEPDLLCKEPIESNIKGLHDVVHVEKGCWNEETTLRFDATGSSGGHISEDENCNVINVIPIDECSDCQNATFIKMDLEGAEWEALHGAEKTIKRNKPLLAISIYHSDEDMIRLIPYIHDLVPEYKLYVRQHKKEYRETILYAKI